MKELLQEKGLWVAVVITMAGMIAGIPFYDIKPPLESGSFLKFFETALKTQIILFLIPITSVLSMGAVYVRESTGGFLKLYITRISRMEYIRRKTMQIYGSGFMVFFGAGFLTLILCFMFLYPMELKGNISPEHIINVMKILLRISCIGGIMAGVSGIFAALFRNYYMAYGLPFVCYYMLIILKERYLPDMYCMYPAEWIKCQQDWGTDGNGIWVFLLTFSIITILLNGLILYHRLREI